MDRRYPPPERTFKITAVKNRGAYLGTEVDEKWWKRYRKDRLFMRGNGEYWHDDKGFYFRRYLTRQPIFIPFHTIIEIKSGTWHSGRWAAGNLITKIIWRKEGLRLSSGFILSNKKAQSLEAQEVLKDKIKK